MIGGVVNLGWCHLISGLVSYSGVYTSANSKAALTRFQFDVDNSEITSKLYLHPKPAGKISQILFLNSLLQEIRNILCSTLRICITFLFVMLVLTAI